MKNILRIYRIMLRYSGYLILGLFFMLGFAFFSGVSITMAIPLFDYVFMKAKPQIVYSHFPPFLEAISKVLHDFLHQGNLSEIFSKASLK
ncbi:MAG: hypothetical protein JXB60_00830, partial [Candidatus Cloacimonetes bacterium]|nr:hypothetical protein [Candidatus Cloacimonadota bacterium]